MAHNVVVTRAAPQFTTFNGYDPQYKCCCGSMHVLTGAIVIGILELFGVVSNIIGLIIGKVENRPLGLEGSVYYGVTGSIITIVVVILLFVAIKKEHHYLVLPHLVWQMLGTLLLLAGAVALSVLLGTYGTVFFTTALKDIEEYQNLRGLVGADSVIMVVLIVIIIIFFISALLEIWFFVVILRLYRYYWDKRDTNASTTPAVQYSYSDAHGPQPNYGQLNVAYSK